LLKELDEACVREDFSRSTNTSKPGLGGPGIVDGRQSKDDPVSKVYYRLLSTQTFLA
jgi:hypothetical protein